MQYRTVAHRRPAQSRLSRILILHKLAKVAKQNQTSAFAGAELRLSAGADGEAEMALRQAGLGPLDSSAESEIRIFRKNPSQRYFICDERARKV